MARPTGPQDYKSSSFSQRKDDRFSAKEVTAEGESVLQAGETLVRVHTSDAKFYESAADADALGFMAKMLVQTSSRQRLLMSATSSSSSERTRLFWENTVYEEAGVGSDVAFHQAS